MLVWFLMILFDFALISGFGLITRRVGLGLIYIVVVWIAAVWFWTGDLCCCGWFGWFRVLQLMVLTGGAYFACLLSDLMIVLVISLFFWLLLL